MSLFLAHRILIGTAVAFFVFYGIREFVLPDNAGSAGGGFLALLAAAALGAYFRTLGRKAGGNEPRGGPR
ncbi:MAG: hypothetical protein ACRD5D_00280 [Candidatus Polarisedimenticolia bacterium]